MADGGARGRCWALRGPAVPTHTSGLTPRHTTAKCPCTCLSAGRASAAVTSRTHGELIYLHSTPCILAGLRFTEGLVGPGSVLDAGANIGLAACLFATLAPARTVHTFDPLPDNIHPLRALALPTWHSQSGSSPAS
eukprot:7319613-Prymnesium_polylepis.1